MDWPLAYLITFRCHGTWLHGDERGSVDRDNHTYGGAFLEPDSRREHRERHLMTREAASLDPTCRRICEETVREVCLHRGWELLAVNARTNHVHAVISAQSKPEPVLNALKAYCTRRMVEAGAWPPGVKPWSRHGSTPYLWSEDQLTEACAYVQDRQEPPKDHGPRSVAP
jgi:REP element-mobilizing transposase RayT